MGLEGKGMGFRVVGSINLGVVKLYLFAPVRTIKCPVVKILSYLRGAEVPKAIKKD
jgi:hypothetical protein